MLVVVTVIVQQPMEYLVLRVELYSIFTVFVKQALAGTENCDYFVHVLKGGIGLCFARKTEMHVLIFDNRHDRDVRDDRRGPRDRDRDHRPPREDRGKPRGDSKRLKGEEKPAEKANTDARAGEGGRAEAKSGGEKRSGVEERTRLADEEEKGVAPVEERKEADKDRDRDRDRGASNKPRIRNKVTKWLERYVKSKKRES